MPPLHWREKSVDESLRATVGHLHDGEPLILDLKGRETGGMGHHGMLIGANRFGRQEVLRNIVGSLIATHTPEEINFLFADFHDSGTFTALKDLPHVSALVTGLANETDQVMRLADAIEGELVRRQEWLRIGDAANQSEYESARRAGRPLEPMPPLVLVLDDFIELIKTGRAFINLLIQVGRLGRSTGIHMLLAAEALEAGQLRGMDGFLSYRIALPLLSGAESRTVVGSNDAFRLPKERGPACFQVGTTDLVHFRTVESEETDDPSDLLALADKIKAMSRPAYKVLLPPLADPMTLDQLMPPLKVDPVRGLSRQGFVPDGKLYVVFGEEDRAFEHRRGLCFADLSAGSAAIAGEARSGKSNLLRFMIGSLVLVHTPREVQFFCLDFGGGALGEFEDLPHVAGVFDRQEEAGVHATVQEVMSILDERQASFTANGIAGMEHYRHLKSEGHFAEDLYGDVFLVIDGWTTLREDFEQLEDHVVRAIARRGPEYGVHVMATCTRWGDIRMDMRDSFDVKLELKLTDGTESAINRGMAQEVPKDRPGRGLSHQKQHFLAGVPRIDGIHDGDDLRAGVEDFVKRVKRAWRFQPCPKVPR